MNDEALPGLLLSTCRNRPSWRSALQVHRVTCCTRWYQRRFDRLLVIYIRPCRSTRPCPCHSCDTHAYMPIWLSLLPSTVLTLNWVGQTVQWNENRRKQEHKGVTTRYNGTKRPSCISFDNWIFFWFAEHVWHVLGQISNLGYIYIPRFAEGCG